jgi:hypothetical protein
VDIDHIVSSGCFTIPASEWPQAKAAIQEKLRELGGRAILRVGSDGNAEVVPLGSHAPHKVGAGPEAIGEGGVQKLRGFGTVSPDVSFNPGDVHWGRWAKEHPEFGGTPSTRTDQGVPLVQFPNLAKGFSAMRALALEKYNAGRRSAYDLISARGGWTPGNRSAAEQLAKHLGVKPDEDLNLHNESMMMRFQNALARREGSRARLAAPLRHGHHPASHYQHESMLRIHDASGGLVTIAT